jgi:ABC-type Fe3+-hydroxamate transport system substrate-binding protein
MTSIARVWLWTSLALGPAAAFGQAAGMPWVVQDDESRRIELAAPAQRIVSLSAGATAMLAAAGAGARVVGTVVASGDPGATAHILALHPDVVIASTGGLGPTLPAGLEGAGVAIYRHRLARLDDVPAAIERFGRLAGTQPQAAAAAQGLRTRIATLRAAHAAAPPRTLLVQLADQPIFTMGAGQLLSDIIGACGYRNAFAELAGAAPVVGVEAVLARDPDVILAVSDAPALGNEWLARWRGMPQLRAVRFGQLVLFSDARLSRMGPDLIAAAEALCQQLAAPRARPLVLPPH